MKTVPIILHIPHDKRLYLHITKSSAAFSEDETIEPMMLLEATIHSVTKEEDIPSEEELQKADEHLIAINLSSTIHLHRTISRLLAVANERGLLEEDEEGKLKVKKEK